MAGRPVLRNQIAHIESLGPEGEEHILAMLAGGDTVKKVAVYLGFPPTSLASLYKWRDATPERKAAWQQAIAYRAQSLAEESIDIADEANENPDAIRKAELRVKARQWLAGVSDRTNYGKDAAAKLTINVQNMHLTAVESVNRELQQKALRKLRGEPDPIATTTRQTLAAVQGADYDILPDEDDAPEDPYADTAEEQDLEDLL